MELKKQYNAPQGSNNKHLGIEALKKFLNERKHYIYEQQSDQPVISKPNTKEPITDDENEYRITSAADSFEGQTGLKLPFDMISPITDEEDEIANTKNFLTAKRPLTESNSLDHNFNNNIQEPRLMNSGIVSNFPIENYLEPEIEDNNIEAQAENSWIKYKKIDQNTKSPQNLQIGQTRDVTQNLPSSRKVLKPQRNEKTQSPSAQDCPKNTLSREDFRTLKIWYDNNLETLSNLEGINPKIPQKCIDSLIKYCNFSKEEAIPKMEQYISIRMKHAQHDGSNKLFKNTKSFTNKNAIVLPEKENDTKGKHDPANVLIRLKKLTQNGVIQNKDCIHNLIHEMTTCECQKTREACLTILLKSKNNPDCLEEFVKFGGVNLLSSWIESIAFKSGIDFQRNIVKMIMDVLDPLHISNTTIRRSSIGKHVNFIVRSQLEPKSRFYCRDLNIVSQAQNLVSKWRSQIQKGKKADDQEAQFETDSSSQILTDSSFRTKDNSVSNAQRVFASHTNIDTNFQTQEHSSTSNQIKSNEKYPNSQAQGETVNNKQNQFLTGLLNSVKKQAEKQKQRSLDYQNALIEGEKKQWIAKQKSKGTIQT